MERSRGARATEAEEAADPFAQTAGAVWGKYDVSRLLFILNASASVIYELILRNVCRKFSFQLYIDFSSKCYIHR